MLRVSRITTVYVVRSVISHPTFKGNSFEITLQIVNEIADATHLNRSIVEMNIIQEKYGEIGGMYNIK